MKVLEALHIAAVFERADEFDVISNQFDFLPLAFSRLVDTPVVTTIHGFSSERILPVYREYDDVGHYVSISRSDMHPDLHVRRDDPPRHRRRLLHRRRGCRRLPAVPRAHPPGTRGRTSRIEVARRAGLPLVIAGIVHDTEYHEREVLPYVDRDAVRYVGAVEAEERDRLLGDALGAPTPHRLRRAVRAVRGGSRSRTGTPVVAFSRGSMPELIYSGTTGFLVTDVDGAVDAVGRLASLDRAACRTDVEARFTSQRMVADYEALFRSLLRTDPDAEDQVTLSGTN